MPAVLATLLIYLVVHALLLALGLAEGAIPHRIYPSIDLGTALLIGIVASGFTLYVVSRVLSVGLLRGISDGDEAEGPDVIMATPMPHASSPRSRKPRRS